MFIPIIIDPCAFYDYRYLWEYLKYEYHAYKNGWPIIASYEFSQYRTKRPISNVYEEQFYRLHGYELLEIDQEEQVEKYFIPESIYDELYEKTGSNLGTKIYMLQNRYKPFEKYLWKIVKKISARSGEKIEGFITWNAHYKSIDYIAKKIKVPVITNEFSIRMPEFRPLSYFLIGELYGSDELWRNYRCFSKYKQEFDYFSREELLALFLSDKCVEELMEDVDPIYEIGIAGCHPLIATYFSKSMYTDLELIQDVRNQYAEDDIIFRMHPGDEPYQAHYTLKNVDTSLYASQFIKKCRRIVAQGSNVLLEAMLWGKQVYSHDISPFNQFCENNLSNKEGGNVDVRVLNYLLLSEFVPFERICDKEYIRWRLMEKNKYTIYKKNMYYYFDCLNIPREVAKLKSEERLTEILKCRGVLR